MASETHILVNTNPIKVFLEHYKVKLFIAKIKSGQLSLEKFCEKANKVISELANSFCLANVRTLDSTMLMKIITQAENEDHVAFAMRHGKQDMQGRDIGLSPYLRKLDAMLEVNNSSDPITTNSALEFINIIFIMHYLEAKFGPDCEISILSSPNERAKQPSEAVSSSLECPLHIDEERLICMIYNSTEDIYKKHLKADGSVDWNEDDINAVSGKENKYATITKQMTALVKEIREDKPKKKKFTIIITHSQQLSAMAKALGIDIGRLKEYGFLFFGKSFQEVYINGFLSPNTHKVLVRTPSENPSSRKSQSLETEEHITDTNPHHIKRDCKI